MDSASAAKGLCRGLSWRRKGPTRFISAPSFGSARARARRTSGVKASGRRGAEGAERGMGGAVCCRSHRPAQPVSCHAGTRSRSERRGLVRLGGHLAPGLAFHQLVELLLHLEPQVLELLLGDELADLLEELTLLLLHVVFNLLLEHLHLRVEVLVVRL